MPSHLRLVADNPSPRPAPHAPLTPDLLFELFLRHFDGDMKTLALYLQRHFEPQGVRVNFSIDDYGKDDKRPLQGWAWGMIWATGPGGRDCYILATAREEMPGRYTFEMDSTGNHLPEDVDLSRALPSVLAALHLDVIAQLGLA